MLFNVTSLTLFKETTLYNVLFSVPDSFIEHNTLGRALGCSPECEWLSGFREQNLSAWPSNTTVCMASHESVGKVLPEFAWQVTKLAA